MCIFDGLAASRTQEIENEIQNWNHNTNNGMPSIQYRKCVGNFRFYFAKCDAYSQIQHIYLLAHREHQIGMKPNSCDQECGFAIPTMFGSWCYDWIFPIKLNIYIVDDVWNHWFSNDSMHLVRCVVRATMRLWWCNDIAIIDNRAAISMLRIKAYVNPKAAPFYAKHKTNKMQTGIKA